MQKIKILIVDDHLLFGLGLKELLLKESGYEVTGPVTDLNEITSIIQFISPHVILLDINLNGLNGIELGKKLKSEFGNIKIIILTMYEHAVFLKQAKESKMDGYLLKDSDPNVLFSGIQSVLEGGSCFLKIVDNKSSQKMNVFGDKYHLSERELEVANEICKGLNNHEIAEKLTLSYHTIKTHRKNIYTKLSVSNVPELIEVLKS
ncbi:response regulator transcription factor [Lacihabitans soyangensis]|uniref:DNA-binding response regulator n=1 Tax=Lacihabitans soyangensis TaxID=869394 RepID=A0AAE3KX42_9BACT|nr:response regulator transcription factor [Lacihabitans soyangensis]MCP9764050.1 DNA-binding response regulator [Lacihabitans soyangensis]